MNFPDDIQLQRILHLRTPKRRSQRELPPSVEEITGLSRDSLRRHYGHLIVDLSERRQGMSLGNALAIAAGKAAPATAA
jgi:hypothetical protein